MSWFYSNIGRKRLHSPYYVKDLATRSPRVMSIPEPDTGLLIPTASGIAPEDTDRYNIYIGTTKVKKAPYYYNPFAPVNPMFAILGAPGYGKSELLQNFIFRLKLKNPIDPVVIIIDPQGEYKRVLSALASRGIYGVELRIGVDTFINIFDRPEGVSYQRWVADAVVPSILDALKITSERGPRMESVFQRIIMQVYERKGFVPADPSTWRDDPTLLDVMEHVLSEIERLTSSGEKGTGDLIRSLASIRDRLGKYVYGIGTDYFARASTINIASLLRTPVVVVNVKYLGSDEPRNIVILYIFNVLYQLMHNLLPVRNTIRLVFIVDEGWILLKKTSSKEETPLEKLTRQARKFGFMVGVATQKFEDLSETILSLVGTLFIFNPNDPKVVEYAKKAGVPEKTAKQILNLERGWCLVRTQWVSKEGMENPNTSFFVKIDSTVDRPANIQVPRTITPQEFIRIAESIAITKEYASRIK